MKKEVRFELRQFPAPEETFAVVTRKTERDGGPPLLEILNDQGEWAEIESMHLITNDQRLLIGRFLVDK